ncbi:MAG TPA: zf-HC2 domain-containing protein [Chromatiales bacterium]|nr:zf-HC2 domain-containing protein [Chromatiales bacterium]
MLSCKEVSKLISLSQDRSLSPWERVSVRLHLLACKLCRRYRKQLIFLTRAGRRLRHPPHGLAYKLPDTARARMERVLAEAANRGSTENLNG